MNVLYVEDNKMLAESIKSRLSTYYTVDTAFTGKEGLLYCDQTEYEFIILDYFLPDFSGLELCAEIRKTNQTSLILFLTTNPDKNSVVTALNSGADDYLVKPFCYEELTARMISMHRRKNTKENNPRLCSGMYTLDQASHSFYYDTTSIVLNKKEYRIIEYLLINKNIVISRDTLFERLWSDCYYSSNTVDVHIRRIRKKTEYIFPQKLIYTVYGEGYYIK